MQLLHQGGAISHQLLRVLRQQLGQVGGGALQLRDWATVGLSHCLSEVIRPIDNGTDCAGLVSSTCATCGAVVVNAERLRIVL